MIDTHAREVVHMLSVDYTLRMPDTTTASRRAAARAAASARPQEA